MAEAPTEGIHPRHVCLELDAETTSILLTGMGPKAKAVNYMSSAPIAVQRLRRRMRSRGFRMTYTLQLVPPVTPDGTHLSALHLTPVRASRANCLRFLAHKLGISLDSVTLVALVPDVLGECLDDIILGPYTSDAANFIAGMHRVVAVPRPEGAQAVDKDGAIVQHLGVPLKPYVDCNRVAVCQETELNIDVLFPEIKET